MIRLQKAPFFIADFEIQYEWYFSEVGEDIAEGYLSSVDDTLQFLCHHPALGRERRFRNPRLRGIRSFRVNPPFNQHAIFYRFDASALFVERVIHGARDLPRRLLQSPGTD
jgi:plasmid stabilization system protein ParE